MATLQATSLTRYILEPAELRAGTMLNTSQALVIQNLIADYSEEKIALKFDPTNPYLFAQQEAELHGKIGVLKYLLECSALAHEEALQAAQSTQ